MNDMRRKSEKVTNEKPVSIPLDFEEALRDLLVTPPPPQEPKADTGKSKSKKKARSK